MLLRAAVAIAVLLLPSQAGAGVTYDLAFRSQDVNGAPIPGGTANGAGFEFVDEAAARACDPGTGSGCPVLDVIVRSTGTLAGLSISVGFDASNGLSAARADGWIGVVPSMAPGSDRFLPIGSGPTIDTSTVSSFDGAVALRSDAGLAPGTYNVGTVVWDTSTASAGSHVVEDILVAGLDGTGRILPGQNIVDVTGSEALTSGAITIGGAPSVPALSAVGAGLLALALVLAARRHGS